MSSTSTSTGTTLQLQYVDLLGNTHTLPYPLDILSRQAGSRSPSYAKILFIEDFRHPCMGMFNDGVGSAHRDNEVTFSGLPSARLDPQGNIQTGGSNPGVTGPNQTGVVFKRRIADNFSGIFGMEFWFRLTSANWINNGNSLFACSIYNRDGVNGHWGRIWFNTSAANMSLQYLTAGTWTQLDTRAVSDNSHTYEPDIPTDTIDKAGEWHYAKLAVDLVKNQYVSFQFENKFYGAGTAIAGAPIIVSADTGPQALHFSFEVGQLSATRRFLNIAQIVGTQEG